MSLVALAMSVAYLGLTVGYAHDGNLLLVALSSIASSVWLVAAETERRMRE